MRVPFARLIALSTCLVLAPAASAQDVRYTTQTKGEFGGSPWAAG
jgi:hypothetical protein